MNANRLRIVSDSLPDVFKKGDFAVKILECAWPHDGKGLPGCGAEEERGPTRGL